MVSWRRRATAQTPRLHEPVPPTDWSLFAACRGADTDLFFPVGSTGDAVVDIDAAVAICQVCPVRLPCLEFALATNQEFGIWGGATEDERRTLRRRQAGTASHLHVSRSGLEGTTTVG